MTMMQESSPSSPRPYINTNTGISIGSVVILISGIIVILNALGDNKRAMADMKNEQSLQAINTKNELMGEIRDLKNRMANIETSRGNTVSTGAFFRWAVHLQQSNPQIKVPEPEADEK